MITFNYKGDREHEISANNLKFSINSSTQTLSQTIIGLLSPFSELGFFSEDGEFEIFLGFPRLNFLLIISAGANLLAAILLNCTAIFS